MCNKKLLGLVMSVTFFFSLSACEKSLTIVQTESSLAWTALPREIHIMILHCLIAMSEHSVPMVAESRNSVISSFVSTMSKYLLGNTDSHDSKKPISAYTTAKNYLSTCRLCLRWRADKDFMKPLIEGVKIKLNPYQLNFYAGSKNAEEKKKSNLAALTIYRMFRWYTKGAILWAKHFFELYPDLRQFVQEKINTDSTWQGVNRDPNFYFFPEPWLESLQQLGFTIPFLADGKTSLIRAAQSVSPAHLKRIIKMKCCNINAQDRTGNSALQLAIAVDNYEHALHMVDNCPEIDLRGVDVKSVRKAVPQKRS